VLEQQSQERRLVTVLFADFAGFTELADQMDPEELQVLVSGIFEDLAEEAIRHDGTIEKFIGDAIFVVFGAPVAHEDDPQRALRTALAMQRVFADHAARGWSATIDSTTSPQRQPPSQLEPSGTGRTPVTPNAAST